VAQVLPAHCVEFMRERERALQAFVAGDQAIGDLEARRDPR
jgi:hypothetical protein